MKIHLVHVKAVLRNQLIEDGSLLIEEGRISAINPLSSGAAKEIELQGAYLLPGLIDLHCDALEKEIEPRPGVHFPVDFALAEMDKRNAMAGITTPFHGISFAGTELGLRSNALASKIVEAAHHFKAEAMLDHRIHCRYEITDPDGQFVLFDLLQQGWIDLISLMDHTPGQGQFKDIAAFQDYLVGIYDKSEAEIAEIVTHKFASQNQTGSRVEAVVAAALAAGIPVASHDDDSSERLIWMHRLGVTLSEFPITLEICRKAREMGLTTLFGAPNLLRGKSQSGSMKAAEAIEHDVADILCSDYAPATLLPAIFRVASLQGWDLSRAARLATVNPADALALTDRGELAVGKRADLIAVGNRGSWPQVIRTWSRGREVYLRSDIGL